MGEKKDAFGRIVQRDATPEEVAKAGYAHSLGVKEADVLAQKIVGVIINDAHKEKINEMIRAVEGKASARTCTYDDVVALRDRAEKKLRGGGESGTALVISKAHLRGTIASYHAQVSCNSYGSYYASATVIQIIYDGEKWKFGLPSREEFSTININSENVYALRLSELAEQDVIARARAKYRKV